MRFNLRVPYAQKDAAKALGARWDAARKIWYVVDPSDVQAFAAWDPQPETAAAAPASAPATLAAWPSRPSAQARPGIFTGPAAVVPVCACKVLPWETCAHTPAHWQALAQTQVA